MDDFIKIFKALTDRNRIRILKMLGVKDLCVCEITSVLNISTSTVSSHLALLKEAGFISDTKDGKWVDYHFNRTSANPSANPVLHQVLAMLSGWLNDDGQIIEDREIIKTSDREKICSN